MRAVASVVNNSVRPHGQWPTRLLCPLDFPGKNTGVGYHFLLQGIFLTQGLYARLLHRQADSLPLSHQAPLYSSVGLSLFTRLCKRSAELFHLAQLNLLPIKEQLLIFFSSQSLATILLSLSDTSFKWSLTYHAELGGSNDKKSACSAGDPGSIPGSEDPLEKEMATDSSVLA